MRPVSRLFMRFSMIWWSRFVHCVPPRTSPVAVRVAVHTQRTRSVWGHRITYEFAVGLLRLSRAELYSHGDLRDPAHPAPVVPDLFRPVRPRERRLRSTSIPPQQPGRMPLLRWQRRGVWAALSTALEARLWDVLFRHARLLCLGERLTSHARAPWRSRGTSERRRCRQGRR